MAKTPTDSPQRKKMPLGHMASFDREIFLDLLDRAGLTQRELAVRLGVSRGVVGHWAQGRSKPSPPHVPALARVLGVEPLGLTGKRQGDEDIADLRVCMGMHGNEAAALAEIPLSQVSNLEMAVNKPNFEHLDALAEVYKVSPEKIRQAWINRRVGLYGEDALETLDEETRAGLGLV